MAASIARRVIEPPLHKPRARGHSHLYAAFASAIAGVLLVTGAPAQGRFVAAVFACTATAMFAVSAFLHRGDWSPVAYRRLHRLDHTTIFLLIAGTYTPVLWLGTSGALRTVVLTCVWVGAIAGITFEWLPTSPPRGYVTAVYLTLGWAGAFAFPQLFSTIGSGFWLVAGGGLLYTVGVVVLAARSPDPWPDHFGYHEIWHVFVITAVLLHYVAIAWFVLPLA